MAPSYTQGAITKPAPRRLSGPAVVFACWPQVGRGDDRAPDDGRGKGGTGRGARAAEAFEPFCWPLSAAPGTEARCALVLYGLPKHFRARCLPSLLQRVAARVRMGVDVFVHTYDLTRTTNSRNGEHACALDPQEVHAAHPLRVEMQSQELVDRQLAPLLSEMKQKGDAWFNHFVSLRNVLRQYNSIQRAYALMEAEQAERGHEYALVCCSRMDVLYLDELPDECVRSLAGLPPGCVWVPSFHEWELRSNNLIYPTGGMNDRFAIGCRHAMRAYANRLPACVEYCRSLSRMFHTETFLKHHLAQARVQVRRMGGFRFQRIRGTGQVHDTDRELEKL